ncbi:hypothetical protein DBR11_06485, partial [Pedobacter sp. HMWF019]|uniref:FecR family protein n=1 Tax=Pedobacter sp. HMWF019 TaxID=2056856 RepID=UPI000D40358C
MEQPVDRPLIRKFIAGACSDAEQLAVNRFLELPEGEALFNEVLKEQWEEAADFQPDNTLLSQWKKQLYDRIDNKQEADNTDTGVQRKINYFTRYAAIWIVAILGIGGYAAYQLKYNKPAEQHVVELVEESNPYGQRSSFLLSDSTRVYLGAGSKLSFSKNFLRKQRIVKLVGEAYFEVTKNPKRPFVIYTGSVRTTVLGTSFKINAFQGKPLMVAVTTGKVRVDHLLNNQQSQSLAVLTPGRMLTYDQGNVLEAGISISDTEKWKNGLLVFKAAPLKELTAEIGRWYNVSIAINRKSLSEIPVSVTLDANVPINKLLDALSLVGNFKYRLK